MYIDVGTRHFTLSFKKQTDSRVALVTGITRKEIGQIRRGQARRPGDAMALANPLAARVVGRWLAGPPYAADGGPARTLPYERAGDAAGFVDLVGEIGGDIPPRAVLDELLRVGAYADAARRGSPRRARLSPAGRRAGLLGTDAAELIEAIAHNIDQLATRRLQRRSSTTSARPRAEVRDKVRSLGSDFARAVNQLLGSYDRDRNPATAGGARTRAVVAVYYWCRCGRRTKDPRDRDLWGAPWRVAAAGGRLIRCSGASRLQASAGGPYWR